MNKSLSSRLMYSFMALIMVIVVGVTAGISYLIADYFFKTNEQELATSRSWLKKATKWPQQLNILWSLTTAVTR